MSRRPTHRRTAHHASHGPHQVPHHALHATHGRPFDRAARARVLLALLLVALFVAADGAPAFARLAVTTRQLVLTASADTYSDQQHPTQSQGGRPYVFALYSTDLAYLRFNAPSVAAASTIVGAKLQLFTTYISTKRPGVQVYAAADNWSERTLTARDKPARGRALASSSAVPTRGRWISLSLKKAGLVSRTGPTSFEVRYSTAGSNFQFASRESAHAPRLVLTVQTPVNPGPTPVTTPTPTPPTSTAPTPPANGASTVTTDLPFDLPDGAESGASSKKLVFAHYFTPYPISLDNQASSGDYYTRNYLSATGENSAHAAYGGLLRDRPLPRAPLSGNWQLTDMETEVRQAMSAGIDGFTVDLLSLGGTNLARVQLLMQAANTVDPKFKIMLMPDMTSSVGKQLDDAGMAAYLAKLAAYPSAYHLADGRLVVSPFAAERWTVSQWSDTMSILKSQYGITVAFVPCFLNLQANEAAFAPISYGMSYWGVRSPTSSGNAKALAALADSVHALGKIWMQPVAVQDARPDQHIYDEADNFDLLQQDWQGAISGNADWVQMTTWNDYSESTSFAPSVDHGWTYLDISSYYLTQFKTGQAPTIVRDALYVSHRTQLTNARSSTAESSPMTLRPGSLPARNDVEVLSMLTAPATVTLSVGGASYSWVAPAGVSTYTEPLGYGTISVSAQRSGTTVASVTSPYTVTADPAVQNLEYYGVDSLRSGS